MADYADLYEQPHNAARPQDRRRSDGSGTGIHIINRKLIRSATKVLHRSVG